MAGLMPWGLAALTTVLIGCQSPLQQTAAPPPLDATAWQGARVVLVGEQHDGPQQGELHAQLVRQLMAGPGLHALVLEMADAGRDTRSLAPDASEDDIQAALAWSPAWPWARYSGAIVAAVREGVPVVGGNLPRSEMREAMGEVSAIERQAGDAWSHLQTLVRQGHCELLHESQIPAMTRIQIAKDQRMAKTLLSWAQTAPDREAVLLISGAVHAHRQLGVPLHLSESLALRSLAWVPANADAPQSAAFDAVVRTPPAPETDHCAQLRQRWSRSQPSQGDAP